MEPNIDNFLIDSEGYEDHLSVCPPDAGSAKCDFVNG